MRSLKLMRPNGMGNFRQKSAEIESQITKRNSHEYFVTGRKNAHL